MSEILGIETINKSLEEKEMYYTKLLNTLHDVYIHLGYTPDPRFIEALRLRKAVPGMGEEEFKMMSEFDDFRLRGYTQYLIDVIKENVDRVSPEDAITLKLFTKENQINDYGEILYKCRECETEEEDDVSGVKIVKNVLGQIVKED